jgi:hypothetical protein
MIELKTKNSGDNRNMSNMNAHQRHLFLSNDPRDVNDCDERSDEDLRIAESTEEDRLIAWKEMMDEGYDG